MKSSAAVGAAGSGCLGSRILLAALAISGVQATRADTAPEQTEISYKYLDYVDMQSGWDRMTVHANAVSVLAPIAGNWSIGGSWTRDIVSGASPAFHSEQLLAGNIEEKRYGREAALTRYFQRGSVSFGVSDSQESDYTSRGYSLTGSLSTEDKNTTFSLGYATSHDKIDVLYKGIRHESKDTDSFLLGVTHVLTQVDIVQLNMTLTDGNGYYSDPYKFRDHRPDAKNQRAFLGRWNHHFRALDGTSRVGYRYYVDSFGVNAHSIDLEYVQPLPHAWTVTPIVRFYAQSQADFYLDSLRPPIPQIRPLSQLQSQDQRLSTFGAITYGIKLSKEILPGLEADVKLERYEQQSDWYPFGDGSPDIAPFRATMMQFGVSYAF